MSRSDGLFWALSYGDGKSILIDDDGLAEIYESRAKARLSRREGERVIKVQVDDFEVKP
jgi:hypothetical protein